MPTRNVVLTDHQAALVERLVSVGRYQNVSEVLRDGLRLVETREAEDKLRLQGLREAVRHGSADADAHRVRAFDSSAELHRHLTALSDAVLGQTKAQARAGRR